MATPAKRPWHIRLLIEHLTPPDAFILVEASRADGGYTFTVEPSGLRVSRGTVLHAYAEDIITSGNDALIGSLPQTFKLKRNP